jgi:hypothetical protein
VLLSLIYRLIRALIGLLTVIVRSGLSKDVEPLVLRHENQVLRRQIKRGHDGIRQTGSGWPHSRG